MYSLLEKLIIYMWASKLIIDSFIYVFFNYYFLFKGSNQFMGSDQTIP